MADQIKQIYAGTAYIGQLTDGVAIASTNSTTQNVIKDIVVANNTAFLQAGAGTNLVINGVVEASINSSVTGTAYVDVSSTALAIATASFTNSTYKFYQVTGGSAGRLTTLSQRKVNGNNSYATASQSATNTTALTGSSSIVGTWLIGSNFFYLSDDGNANQTLYRRVGGVNGTQNVVFSTVSYATIVFDGTDKFYRLSVGPSVETYNATTNTITSVAIQAGLGFPSPGSSYPRISFANGFVFYASSANTSVWVVNPATGFNTYINAGLANVIGTTFGPFDVYYNSGNYYILSANNSRSGFIIVTKAADFGPLTSSNGTGQTAISSTNISLAAPNQAGFAESSAWPKMDKISGDWLYLKSVSGNLFTYGCINSLTGRKPDVVIDATDYPPTGAGATGFVLSEVFTVDDSANKTNTTYYPQSISLRVTGVQTTL